MEHRTDSDGTHQHDTFGGRRSRRRRLAALPLAVALVVGLLVGAASPAPAATATGPDRAGSGDLIVGVGHFTLDEPEIEGHRIRFEVRAHTDRDGEARGTFRFRHLLADGSLLGTGRADVTCVEVSGDTALFTAVVTREHIPPVPPGLPLGPHAFYVKVIDGGGQPDQVVFIQAIDPPGPLDPSCVDAEERFPDQVVRYPLDRGGYRLRG
jgi:hypothetical protein